MTKWLINECVHTNCWQKWYLDYNCYYSTIIVNFNTVQPRVTIRVSSECWEHFSSTVFSNTRSEYNMTSKSKLIAVFIRALSSLQWLLKLCLSPAACDLCTRMTPEWDGNRCSRACRKRSPSLVNWTFIAIDTDE